MEPKYLNTALLRTKRERNQLFVAASVLSVVVLLSLGTNVIQATRGVQTIITPGATTTFSVRGNQLDAAAKEMYARFFLILTQQIDVGAGELKCGFSNLVLDPKKSTIGHKLSSLQQKNVRPQNIRNINWSPWPKGP